MYEILDQKYFTHHLVNVPVDRVKDRLEQLDQDDEEDEILQLTQKDYQRHIEKKRESLIQAWDTDKRVRALKIAIKVLKFFHDILHLS